MAAFAAVHALGDRAGWTWKSVTRVLTGCTQTLDIYHAGEHLSRCAKAVFGDGTAAAAFERGRGLLLADGWAGVCAWVGQLLAVEDVAERERRRRATDRVIGYFAKHTERLNYRERLASGRAIGSGAVEGQAKTLGLRLRAGGPGGGRRTSDRWRLWSASATPSSGRPTGRWPGEHPRKSGCTQSMIIRSELGFQD